MTYAIATVFSMATSLLYDIVFKVDEFKKEGVIAKMVIQFHKPFFWELLIGCLISLISYRLIKKNFLPRLIQDDFAQSKLKWRVILRRYYFVKSIISGFYEFQLIHNQILLRAKNSEKSLEIDYIRPLLKQIQTSVGLATGADISVSIKIFVQDGFHQSNGNLKDQHLFTMVREPSIKECERVSVSDFLHERSNEEEFCIFRERFKPQSTSSGDKVALAGEELKTWIHQTIIPKAKQFEKDKHDWSYNRVNSAYCYVMGNHRPYYISNDLKKEEEQGYFYSNSENWDKYYRSMAVFRIAHYDLQKKSNTAPNGLLIVDSYSTHVFESGFMRHLIGYYAHRLHPLVEVFKTKEREKNERKRTEQFA